MITDNIINDEPATTGPAPADDTAPLASESPAEPTDDVVEEPAEETESEIPAEEAPVEEADAPTEEQIPEEPKADLQWYVVKVQSNREDSIKEAIERRVKIEGLQDSFGEIVIPTEKVSEMRGKKRVIRERKLLPGYLMVRVEFNEHMLYLFRETSGVGDFVGAGLNKKPIPMTENEIKKWIGKADGTTPGTVMPTAASPFNEADRVKVKDGMFAGMEGVVKTVLEAKGAVIVELTIFGRPVPVELEYWQVDFA
jgi:transcription termination/antitermination protein NusG